MSALGNSVPPPPTRAAYRVRGAAIVHALGHSPMGHLGAGVKAQGYPKTLRLRRRNEFLRVQRGGHKHHVRHFLVFVSFVPEPSVADVGASGGAARGAVASSTLPPPRVGVTVTRKVGGAVVRNRIKRWVREAFRRKRARFAPGIEMVWVAKKDAVSTSFDEVMQQMEALARRLDRPAHARGATTP